MRFSKYLLTLVMALTLCLSANSLTVLAATEETLTTEMTAAAFNEDSGIMPLTNDYTSCWVPAGKTSGYFTIDKTFTGPGHVTFKARSDNTAVTLDMKVSKSSDPQNAFTDTTGWMSLSTNNAEAKPTTTLSSSGVYYVHYNFKNTNPNGTFLMCWIYG